LVIYSNGRYGRIGRIFWEVLSTISSLFLLFLSVIWIESDRLVDFIPIYYPLPPYPPVKKER